VKRGSVTHRQTWDDAQFGMTARSSKMRNLEIMIHQKCCARKIKVKNDENHCGLSINYLGLNIGYYYYLIVQENTSIRNLGVPSFFSHPE
jgi:hypothetical protein